MIFTAGSNALKALNGVAECLGGKEADEGNWELHCELCGIVGQSNMKDPLINEWESKWLMFSHV